MSDYLPIKQDIFHLWAGTDVVHNHIGAACSCVIYHDPNVRDAASDIPCDDIARRVVFCSSGHRQLLTPAGQEDHEIRNATVIDVLVWTALPAVRIGIEGARDVFVNFFL